LGGQHQSEVGVCLGKLGRARERAAQQRLGITEVAGLQSNDAEQMQGTRFLRCAAEDRSVGALRVREPPSLMVRRGLRQRLVELLILPRPHPATSRK
jgi:hypothetical protein